MEKNMTALISCFIRAYHWKNSKVRIYDDPFAEKMLNKEEYKAISKNMIEGVDFFAPGLKEKLEEAAISEDRAAKIKLAVVVNSHLAPPVLARSKFNDIHIKNETALGLEQYLVLGVGYDTSAYGLNKSIKVYELDRAPMIDDKIKRVKEAEIDRDNVEYIGCDFEDEKWIRHLLNSSFDASKKTHCSLLGLSYYFKKESFAKLIFSLGEILPKGSSLLFDYPNDLVSQGKTKKLAKAAGEDMKASFTFKEIETLAGDGNFLVYEHIGKKEVDENYFKEYNCWCEKQEGQGQLSHKDGVNADNKITAIKINAPQNVGYCFLVKDKD